MFVYLLLSLAGSQLNLKVKIAIRFRPFLVVTLDGSTHLLLADFADSHWLKVDKPILNFIKVNFEFIESHYQVWNKTIHTFTLFFFY